MNAIVDLEADVEVLSEYRRSPAQQDDEDAQLYGAGYKVAKTVAIPRSPAESRTRDNQILVAAPEPITILKSAGHTPLDCALDNYCHIQLSGIDSLRLRIPPYQDATRDKDKEDHWMWLLRTLNRLVKGRSIPRTGSKTQRA